jgi:tape measure domain-containing protein
MSGVDSRIVTMKFDNKQFQEGAAATMSVLDKLKSALGFSGASKGLDQVQASANKMNFGAMEGGITHISAKFMALSTIAITALSGIASKAMAVGTSVAKSLTIDPIKGGFDEYELKMGSIQTIMAGSGESLATVNKYLGELNTYSDKTIYSFKDMTSNIGKFTNAGVNLKDSVGAIQGIANVAAISGANAEEASRAMYNFAQSLSQGSVKLMDWKSIELANMATKEFKTQLLESAVAAGTLTKTGDGMYKTLKNTPVTATKGFNESLSEQWLTSEALVKTLGDYSNKETDIGKRATAAASDVKTFSQMMDTMKESAGSGWANTSELIFGNFEEAKKLWTGVNDVLGGMISSSADARNKVLSDWNALGGRTMLIEAIRDAFWALMAVLKPIKDAFREIFPAKTGKDLMDFTVAFRDLMANLIIGGGTAEKLKRTFKGVFAVFSIIKMVISGVIGVIMDLVESLSSGSGGFLDFTAGIGDWLVNVERAIRNGEGLTKFFAGLTKVLQVPLTVLKNLIKFIGNLFDGAGTAMGEGSPLQSGINGVSDGLKGIPGLFSKIGQALQPMVDKFIEVFSTIGQKMADSFSYDGFNALLSAINTALFGGLVLLVKRFLDGGGIFGQSGVKNMFDSVASTFGALTGQMTAMQKNVKADTMMKIAAAVGILTVSIVALSMIDSDKLVKALSAVGVSFGMLLGAMQILDKIGKSGGFLKMPFITGSMIAFSVAILILTAAVKNLSDLSWEELGKGLSGVAGLMVILAVAVKPLSANAAGMTAAGVGILALSVGLKVLATVVKDFAEMSWADMGKGLAGVAGSLLVLAGAMRLLPSKSMIGTAVSIGILAASLKIMASAITDFAAIPTGDIVKGLVGIAGALLIIAGAMQIMPKNMPLTAAGLILVSIALLGISKAVQTMGGMSWEALSNGLKGLGLAMLILVAGLNAMNGTLAGSAALLVAAVALGLLTPVLMVLGKMPWGDIVKGLAAIAGVFVILGLAGLLLTPLSPVIALLAVSILALGAGLALAGVGALAFVTAFSMLVGLGAAAAITIGAMLSTIIKKIPEALKAFAMGIIMFAATIAKGGPAFVAAMTTVILAIIKAVSNAIPKLAALFLQLINTGLAVITTAVPRFAAAGLKMLLGILGAISANIGKIVTVAGDIIAKFLNGIANNIPKIVTAGANIIIKFMDAMAKKIPELADRAAKAVITFVNGISTAIDNNSAELGAAGGRLATSIVKGMVNGLGAGIRQITDAARNLAKSALNAAKDFLGIKSPSKEFEKIGKYVNEGFRDGLVGGLPDVDAALEMMKSMIVDSMADTKAAVDDAKDNLGDASDAVKAAEARLKDLQNNKKPNKDAIKAAKVRLAEAKQAQAEARQAYGDAKEAQKAANAANLLMTQQMAEQQNQLRALGAQYDDITSQLKDAKSALDQAISARDSANSSIRGKFDDLPDIAEETSLLGYEEQLRKSIDDTNKFKATLDQLRSMGMDNTTYQKFLDEGTSAQPFLEQLLASGAGGIAELNSLNAQLSAAAANLGNTASAELYQAGVNAAQGLVDGLTSQQAAIEAQMTAISNAMISAIKSALGIASPSKEFAKIGKYSTQGLAKGLSQYSYLADKAAFDVGEAALEAMKTSLTKVSDIVISDMDINPVIAPVLDLSQVQREASKMGAMLSANPITAGVSFDQASSISADNQSKNSDVAEAAAQAAPTTITFEQNNYSPEALSAVDIYRQSKNILSLAEEALKV